MYTSNSFVSKKKHMLTLKEKDLFQTSNTFAQNLISFKNGVAWTKPISRITAACPPKRISLNRLNVVHSFNRTP